MTTINKIQKMEAMITNCMLNGSISIKTFQAMHNLIKTLKLK